MNINGETDSHPHNNLSPSALCHGNISKTRYEATNEIPSAKTEIKKL